MVAARIGYNYGGIKGYSEADLEGGPLRFAVAAGVIADFGNDNDDKSFIQPQVDFIAKLQGFSLTGGAYFSWEQEGEKWTDQKYSALGLFGQLGYLFAKKYELAARYSIYEPDGPSNTEHEATAGISIYFYKHNLKWQTEVALLRTSAPNKPVLNDIVVRSQIQLSF